MNKLVDFHIHSKFSGCAARENTIENIINEAIRKGLKKIVITDHFFQEHSYYHGATDLRQFLDHLSSIKKVRQNCNLKVLAGVEIDVTAEGDVLAPEEVFKKTEWIAAGVHFHDGRLPFNKNYQVQDYEKRNKSMAKSGKHNLIEESLKAHIKAAGHPCVNTIAHPFENMGMAFLFSSVEELPFDFINVFFQRLKATKKPFEFNRAIYTIKTPESRDFVKNYTKVVKMAVSQDIPIVLGSDAHSLNDIGHTPWREYEKLVGENSGKEFCRKD